MGDKKEAPKEDLGKLGDADALMAEVIKTRPDVGPAADALMAEGLKKLQADEQKKLHDAEEALQKASVDGIYKNPSPG